MSDTTLIALARRLVAVIRGHLGRSFGSNGFSIAAAALGWLSPALAALLLVLSTAFVVGNALRLGRPALPVAGAAAGAEPRAHSAGMGGDSRCRASGIREC